MESLMADFAQFSAAFAKFLVLEGRLGTRLYMQLILRNLKVLSCLATCDTTHTFNIC